MSDENSDREYDLVEEVLSLKSLGTQLFEEGNYHKAIEVWLQSVKEALKKSVSYASVVLYENQWICRLNIAQAYIKLGEWVEAKDQLTFVLEQRPYNVKALLRLATVYLKLQDEKLCTQTLDKLQKICSAVVQQTTHEINEANQDKDQPKSDTEQSNRMKTDEHTNDSEDENYKPNKKDMCGFTVEEIQNIIQSMRYQLKLQSLSHMKKEKHLYKYLGKNLDKIDASANRQTKKEITKSVSLDEKMVCLAGADVSNIIQWEYKTKKLFKNQQLTTDISDNTVIGMQTNTSKRIDEQIQKDQQENEKESNEIASDLFTSYEPVSPEKYSDYPHNKIWSITHSTDDLKTNKTPTILSLPLSVLSLIEKICLGFTDEAGIMSSSLENPDYRQIYTTEKIAEDKLSLVGRVRINTLYALQQAKSLVLHVLGVSGNIEMECQWSALLNRLPNLNFLTIIFIGFLDSTDPWSKSLKTNNLSPPLVKKQGHQPHQKLTCYIFKGNYQAFLQSEPDVLNKAAAHKFYPDFIMMREPKCCSNLESHIVVLDKILNQNIPLLISGSIDDGEEYSKDTKTFVQIVSELKGEWVIPLYRNPYGFFTILEENIPKVLEVFSTETCSRIEVKNGVIGCVIGSENKRAEDKWIQQDEIDFIKHILGFKK